MVSRCVSPVRSPPSARLAVLILFSEVYKIDMSSIWMSCIPEARNGYPESMRSNGCHIGVCSRKRDYYDTPDSIVSDVFPSLPLYLPTDGLCQFWRVARDSGVAARIRDIPYPNISVHGELVGASILDNTMKYPANTHEFIVFGIFNMDTGKVGRFIQPFPQPSHGAD